MGAVHGARSLSHWWAGFRLTDDTLSLIVLKSNCDYVTMSSFEIWYRHKEKISLRRVWIHFDSMNPFKTHLGSVTICILIIEVLLGYFELLTISVGPRGVTHNLNFFLGNNLSVADRLLSFHFFKPTTLCPAQQPHPITGSGPGAVLLYKLHVLLVRTGFTENLEPTQWLNGQTLSAPPSRTSSPRLNMKKWALLFLPGDTYIWYLGINRNVIV